MAAAWVVGSSATFFAVNVSAADCADQESPSASPHGWQCPPGMRYFAEPGVCWRDGPQLDRDTVIDERTGVSRRVVMSRYACVLQPNGDACASPP